MALIKCPNCGLDVSEKATTCVHCGASLASQNNFSVKKCPECGTSLEDSAKVCPFCGYPIDESDISTPVDKVPSPAVPLQSKQHKYSSSPLSLSTLKQLPKKVIVAILILLVLLVKFIIYKSIPKKNPFFYELPSDTSYDLAADILQREYYDYGANCASPDLIFIDYENYLGYENLTGQIDYVFSNGTLSKVSVLIMYSDESDSSDENIGKFLYDKISSVYGKGTERSGFYSYSWDSKNYYVTQDYLYGQLSVIRYGISFIPK